MNWLKKILQNKKTDNKSDVEAEAPKEATGTADNVKIISVSSIDKFVDMDNEFINLFYFKDQEEKMKYIERINTILSQLEIEKGMDYVTVHRKLTSYNYDAENTSIPFLTDCLLFQSYLITKTERGGKPVTVNEPTDNRINGAEKIKSYYLGLNFCRVNLQRKIDNNFFDFQYEENLIEEILEKSNIFNFARIDTLFALGEAQYKANNLRKMEIAFESIRAEQYDLEAPTIANYYRLIAEIYIALEQSEKALDWLKTGLKLNPKLGVKKLVDRLEKDKTNYDT